MPANAGKERQAKKPAQERVEPLPSHPCVLTQRARAFLQGFLGVPTHPAWPTAILSKFDPTELTALPQFSSVTSIPQRLATLTNRITPLFSSGELPLRRRLFLPSRRQSCAGAVGESRWRGIDDFGGRRPHRAIVLFAIVLTYCSQASSSITHPSLNFHHLLHRPPKLHQISAYALLHCHSHEPPSRNHQHVIPPLAMSSAPTIRAGKAKPKKLNAARQIMHREQRAREKSVAASLSVPPATAVAEKPARSVCKNPQCDKSDVRDGACQNCGRVVWESNIVAEVTFGESASGAAVVHGSYLAADQGGIRPTAGGLAFRRVAGAGASEARERSLREAKQLMNQFAHQLQIAPHVSEKAFQVYKFASNSNFIQGRRKNTVAAVCVYAVCRKEDNNKVMLIDLADIIKTDVFLLGRSYKDLLNALPDMKDGTKPIIIEDLIFRFASKLEFLHDTNKVALSAIRIAQRMRHDNITHGRRPAGICGAALIMAARAHNYRRTVREVVYIAKVTMTTLQERMEEFANVPSAQMTIQDFHEAKALPEASHDPPFVYKQSKEWQEKHPKKAKKRKALTSSDSQAGTPETAKRQKTASTEPRADSIPIDPALEAETVTENPVPPRAPTTPVLDKDGFVVPPRKPTEEELTIANAATADVDGQLEDLADEFGDSEEEEVEEEVDPSSEMAMAAAQGIQVPGMENMKIKAREAVPTPESNAEAEVGDDAGKKKEKPTLRIDEEWELDETNLEQEMQGHLNDPVMLGASAIITQDVERRREKAAIAHANRSLPAPETINNPPADANTT